MKPCLVVFLTFNLISIRQFDEECCISEIQIQIQIRQLDVECCISEREQKLIIASLCLWKEKIDKKIASHYSALFSSLHCHCFIIKWYKTEIFKMEQLS